MNYYPHHIADFNNATRHLNRVERSIYRDLLDIYYDTEAPLTLVEHDLARKVIARTEEEIAALRQVLSEFFIKTEAGWRHERCEAVLAEYRAKIEKCAAAGLASAKSRKEKAEKRQAKPAAKPMNSTGVQQPLNGRSTDEQPPIDKRSTDEQQAPDIRATGEQQASNQPRTNNQNQKDSVSKDTATSGAPDAPPTDPITPPVTGAELIAPVALVAPVAVTTVTPAGVMTEEQMTEMWRSGKDYLAQNGMTVSTAGAYIGSLCRKYGKPIVAQAIGACLVEQPAEARSYMTQVCKNLLTSSRTQQGFSGYTPVTQRQAQLEAHNDSVSEDWAARKEAEMKAMEQGRWGDEA